MHESVSHAFVTDDEDTLENNDKLFSVLIFNAVGVFSPLCAAL